MGETPEIVPEIAIVGAGPAGATAALRLARVYLNVLLIDQQPHAGGRAFPKPDDLDVLAAPDYRGQALRRGLRESAAQIAYRAGWRAVELAPDLALTIEENASGRRERFAPKAVILATGGIDPKPNVPGADLPGVFALGDSTSLLIAAAERPRVPIVLGGSGPLLWCMAAELIGARRTVTAVVDAAPLPGWRQLRGMVRQPGLLEQGLGWTRAVWGSSAAIHRTSAITAIRAAGGGLKVEIANLDAARQEPARPRQTVAAEIIALGQGMRPNLALLDAAGVATIRDSGDRPRPQRSDELETSVPGLFVAGDAGRAAGLEPALCEGTIAAAAVARRFGRGNDAALDAAAAEARHRLRALQPFLAAVEDWSGAAHAPAMKTG